MIPKLSELPSDSERRNAVLDSAHAEPGPEQKPTSRKARKVETYAATAAAALGLLLSDHKNVTIGSAAPIDENLLFEKKRKLPGPEGQGSGSGGGGGSGSGGGSGNGSATPPAEPADSNALVPWIRLK